MNDELQQDATAPQEESTPGSEAVEAVAAEEATQADATEAETTEVETTEADAAQADDAQADAAQADDLPETSAEDEAGAKSFFTSDDSDAQEDSDDLPSIESVFGKAEPKEKEEKFSFPPDEPSTEAPPERPEPAAAPASRAHADSDSDDEDREEEPPLIVDPPDDGVKRRWYAIHAHSGQEANVRRHLIMQAELDGLIHLVTNVLVPMEEVEEFRAGEKRRAKRKYFPGYVLVQLPEHPEHSPDLWHLIKNTPGVTGFIGSRTVPVPLEDSEVIAIVEEIRGERERPRKKIEFEMSERVKIIDGPFSNFLGNIDEINEERGKMKVLVEIFERQTSVEVDYWQVEKI